MSRIVRESKFRHLFRPPGSKDRAYDGVVARDSRLDGEICAVNKLFIAVVLESSSGFVFTILNRSTPGRIDKTYRCIGHSSEIVDLTFNHFNCCQIASGSDDGSFIVWNIPYQGLTGDLDNEYQCLLKASERRAVSSRFHPSAADILIGGNLDSFNIFNTLTEECIRSIPLSDLRTELAQFTLNYNGTKCAGSFKDKKVRIFDLVDGNKTAEFATHEGSKLIKIAWIVRDHNDDLLVTTGATKMSGRQISIWSISNPSSPLYTEDIDNATSALSVYYDIDTKLILVFGKGENSLKFFEFDMDPSPRLHLVSQIVSSEAHRAIAIGDKFSGDITANVVLLCVRVLSKGLEEVSCTVPRKSTSFQADLFPETRGEVPAMTADDFKNGKVCDPLLVNLADYVPPDIQSSSGLSRAVSSHKKGDRAASPSKNINRSPTLMFDVRTQIMQLTEQMEDLQKRVEKLENK